jgi:hypothetical protein
MAPATTLRARTLRRMRFNMAARLSMGCRLRIRIAAVKPGCT